MGQIVGGIIGVYILYAIWEFVLFKRICNDPVTGKLLSVAAAYATAVVIYGFGAADGGPWTPAGVVLYLPGLIFVAVYAAWRGTRIRNEQPAVAETFE